MCERDHFLLRSMQVCVTLAALSAAGLCAYVIVNRISYKYGLEWCESAVLHTVMRVMEGEPLFVAPSVEYTSYEYTPLYYYLGALACLPAGPGFFPIRLVSLTATLATLGLIYLFVKKETGSRWFAGVSACLFTALYGHALAWFDLARVDMVFVAFLTAGVYLLRFHPESTVAAGAAGLLLFLSWFTKQSVSFILFPLFAYLLLTRPRQAITAGAVLGGAAAVAIVAYTLATDGWFWFYTFELLSQQAWTPEHWLGYWREGVFGNTGIMMAAAIIYAARGPRAEKGRWFYLCLLAGLLAGCWMSRLHSGSSINSLLPLYVFGVIGFALWAHRALAQPEERKLRHATLAFVACLAQFYALAYAPSKYLPSNYTRHVGKAIEDLLVSVEGDVFMPTETSLPYFAGKPHYADHIPTTDLFRGTDTAKITDLQDQFRQAFQSGRFSVIIMTEDTAYYDLFKDNYVRLDCGLIESPRYQIYVYEDLAPTLGKKLSSVLPIKFNK